MIVLYGLLALICRSSAHAEESAVVTLSCDGTRKVYVKREVGEREPISHLAVVVNLAERTVLFDGNVTHIDQVDDAGVIYFGGDKTKGTTGYINRPTGATRAINMGSDVATYYELVCK
jgi:hypothetical protein